MISPEVNVRSYSVLIIITVLLAFMAGFTALSLRGTDKASMEDVIRINQTKLSFIKNVSPVFIANLDAIYYQRDQLSLLDPDTVITPSVLKKKGDYNHYSTNKDCFKDVNTLLNISADKKVMIWEEYRCGRLKRLPNFFFNTPPFMHPVGKSFAYLSFLVGRNGHRSQSWIKGHLPFFHVKELENIIHRFEGVEGIFEVLTSLNSFQLRQLFRGSKTILGDKYLFIKITYSDRDSGLQYHIFTKDSLNRFLENSSYTLENYGPGKSCFYREDGLCWNYNMRHVFRLANVSTLTLLGGLLIIIVIVVHSLLTKIKGQRLEDEKRRLALRVLTHEFRTPVTSMMLLVESMGKNFDKLDKDTQDSYLAISSEVYRLKRLVETSRNYLKAENSESLLDLKAEQIPSLNEFIEDLVMPFSESHEGITVEYLTEDTNITLDTYWFGICFKNILENSLNHGDVPVKIKMEKNDKFFMLSFQDSGQCSFDSIEEMSKEFVKGTKSSGTGLGMNIVFRVIKEMGGDISLSTNPTIINIKVPWSSGKSVQS
jgi:hypothetical protein